MYKENDIKRVLALASSNGINLSKEFSDLLNYSDYASEGCRQTAQNSYYAVNLIFKQAFNNGMYSMFKSDVQDTTKVWAKLANPKSVAKLVGYQKKTEDIMYKYLRNKEGGMGIKDVVMAYIDQTIKGSEVISRQTTDDKTSKILNNAINKLEQLKEVVNNALDNSSKQANSYAEQIIGSKKDKQSKASGLLGWWEFTQNKLITPGNEKLLDDALMTAQEWFNIVRIPGKKERIKESEVVIFEDKHFSNYVKQEDVKSIAEQFFKILEEKKKATGQIDEINYEIKSLRKRNQEIEKEIEEWDDKVDAGECSLEDADDTIMMLEDEINDNQEEIDNKKLATNALKSQIRFSRAIIRKYEILKAYYKAYETLAPKYFYDIFSNIDYNTFISVLNGDSTKEENKKAEILLESTLFTIEDYTKRLHGIVGGLENMIKSHVSKDEVKKRSISHSLNEAELRRQKRKEQRQSRKPDTKKAQEKSNQNNIEDITMEGETSKIIRD